MSLNSYRVYQNSVAFKKKMFLQPFYQFKSLLSSKAPHLPHCCDFSSVQVLSCDLFHLSNQESSLRFSTDVTQRPSPHKALELPSHPALPCLPNPSFHSLLLSCQHFATNCSLYLLMKMLLLANS